MGQTIFQKLSLYEMLTMLAIGVFCMPVLTYLLSAEIKISEPIFWVISYSIGLILHRALEFFRNIWSSKSTINYFSCPHFFQTIFSRNYPQAIKDFQYDNEHFNKDYYQKYYHVKNSSYASSISSLEAQEAFLRDLFWVEIIYLLAILFADVTNTTGSQCGKCTFEILLQNKCSCIATLGVVLMLTLLGRYITQRKIYELVQEIHYFCNNVNGVDENNSNNTTKENVKTDDKSVHIVITSNQEGTITINNAYKNE